MICFSFDLLIFISWAFRCICPSKCFLIVRTSTQSNDDDVKIIILMLHLLSRAMNLFLDQANASRHHSGEKSGKNVSMKNTFLIYQLHSELFSLCTRSCVHSSFVSVDLLMSVYTNIILVCGIVYI